MNEFTEALKEEHSSPEPAIIFAACNASLRCSAECPNKLHQQADCDACGNESCVQAWQKLQDVYKSCDYFK
jgi:hypothetical protein